MVSDVVWRGSFHRHIMTSGGSTARPARTAQPDSDRKLPVMPAVQTAETQTAVTVALLESSCILKVYGPVLHGAVPECTGKPQSNPTGPFGPAGPAKDQVPCCGAVRSRTADSGSLRYSVGNGGVAPYRELYVADRRRNHRVDHDDCDHPQSAGPRWRERKRTRLDERAMARRTSRVALSVSKRSRRTPAEEIKSRR